MGESLNGPRGYERASWPGNEALGFQRSSWEGGCGNYDENAGVVSPDRTNQTRLRGMPLCGIARRVYRRSSGNGAGHYPGSVLVGAHSSCLIGAGFVVLCPCTSNPVKRGATNEAYWNTIGVPCKAWLSRLHNKQRQGHGSRSVQDARCSPRLKTP